MTLMVLVAHILIALSSLVVSGWAFLKPSEAKLRASYGLVTATLASGTYLVVSTHSLLTPPCLTGLVYLGVISICIFSARHKLINLEGELLSGKK